MLDLKQGVQYQAVEQFKTHDNQKGTDGAKISHNVIFHFIFSLSFSSIGGMFYFGFFGGNLIKVGVE